MCAWYRTWISATPHFSILFQTKNIYKKLFVFVIFSEKRPCMDFGRIWVNDMLPNREWISVLWDGAPSTEFFFSSCHKFECLWFWWRRRFSVLLLFIVERFGIFVLCSHFAIMNDNQVCFIFMFFDGMLRFFPILYFFFF